MPPKRALLLLVSEPGISFPRFSSVSARQRRRTRGGGRQKRKKEKEKKLLLGRRAIPGSHNIFYYYNKLLVCSSSLDDTGLVEYTKSGNHHPMDEPLATLCNVSG
jgi:hypothetical protein